MCRMLVFGSRVLWWGSFILGEREIGDVEEGAVRKTGKGQG